MCSSRWLPENGPLLLGLSLTVGNRTLYYPQFNTSLLLSVTLSMGLFKKHRALKRRMSVNVHTIRTFSSILTDFLVWF